MSLVEKCPFCSEVIKTDSEGNCSKCHRNIVPVKKSSGEVLQFYCVVCDDFFESTRDGSGYDQAPCPVCGDLSCTPDFHVGEMDRLNQKDGLGWALIALATIFVFPAFFMLIWWLGRKLFVRERSI